MKAYFAAALSMLVAAPSSGYIHEVENGNNAVFGNNDDRAVLVDCVIGIFQFWHSLRQKCRKIQQSVFGNRITNSCGQPQPSV